LRSGDDHLALRWTQSGKRGAAYLHKHRHQRVVPADRRRPHSCR
jgi:hypothetical protein